MVSLASRPSFPKSSELTRKWSTVPIGGDIMEVSSTYHTTSYSYFPNSPTTIHHQVVSPFLPTAPAIRHLKTRGEGGYMIIMQTHQPTALARLQNIKTHSLAKAIFTYSTSESDMVQYHPKDIPGGVIPELDSLASSKMPAGLEAGSACGGFMLIWPAITSHLAQLKQNTKTISFWVRA